MKSALAAVFVVLLGGFIVAALGDIVIFKDGSYEDCTIVSESEEGLSIKGPYGELKYPREQVVWHQRSSAERPGDEYFQAGLRMVGLHRKQTAIELFKKAGLYNKDYERAGKMVIDRTTPKRPTTAPTQIEEIVPGTVLIRLKCPICEEDAPGYADRLYDGRVLVKGRCPACGGKGYRDLRIGPEDGLCPACGGIGSVRGEDEGPVITCPICAGHGVLPVKAGGVREPIEKAMQAASDFNNGGDVFDDGGSGEEPESAADDDSDTAASDDELDSGKSGNFFTDYKWYLIGGGGGLLIVALVAMQLSKPGK